MEYKFEEVNCNICSSNRKHSVVKYGKFNLPTNVVLCTDCGLGYLSPRWTEQSYMDFYKYEYDKYYRPNIINDNSVNNSNPIIKRLDQNDFLPRKMKTILDIGSGAGNNLKSFKSLNENIELFAIEPSDIAQKILGEMDVKVISDDIGSGWEKKYIKKFDIIIMRHVLEHFSDPLNAMKKVKTSLSSSGIVYLAVPNNLKPAKGLKNNWFRNVHTYYFNKYSLTNLMDLAGFEILLSKEGDIYNEAEIYIVIEHAKKNKPKFSKDHYNEQLSVFCRALKREDGIIFRIRNYFSSRLRKIIKT